MTALRRVYLSLGSNLGDRAAHLDCARRGLEAAGLPIVRASGIHETEPWGVAGQPKYLNQCLHCESPLDPLDLLHAVKAIECQCGREPGTRWGPRVIDIDLLLIEGVTVDDEALHLPHRHLTEREFVLAPLAEIAPDLPLPSGRTVREQLQALRSEGPHDG